MTDAELIGEAAGGSRVAFECLYRRHWKAVYSYAWLLSNSVADAEDVTPDCFLAWVRKPRSFDPARAELRTWLSAIVRQQYLGRRRRTDRESGAAELDRIQTAVGFDDELLRVERAEAVRVAMHALPEAQREALCLFEFEGLTLSEVASVLNIEATAVKARLYRAREQLKALLAPLRTGAEPNKGGK